MNVVFFSSSVDSNIGLQLSCSAGAASFSRLHGIGTAWTGLRVGIRYQFDRGNGTLPGSYATSFNLGVSYNDGILTGSPILYPYAKNALAIGYQPQNWTYTAAAGANMARWAGSNGNSNLLSWINNVSAYTSPPITTLVYHPADPATLTRRLFFADFIRGSGTFTARCFYCNSTAASPDVSSDDFYYMMQMAIPVLTNHTYTNASPARAFSESNGVLNNAWAYWTGLPAKVYIYDFGVGLSG